MESVVQLRAVVSVLGGFPALTGVDLDVDAGEVVLLRGANGAGKTSVLRVCAGLQAVASGAGSVLGYDLARDRNAVRRRVGLLGHATSLYDDLTVADNLSFWSRAARSTLATSGADAFDASLERVGLSGRLRDTRVSSLSAGQRRRTALAVLVARRSTLWLLDEPHASFDAEGRDLIDSLVGEAVGAGVTVMLASHDDDRARAISTRVVDLAGGSVVAEPTPTGTTPTEPAPTGTTPTEPAPPGSAGGESALGESVAISGGGAPHPDGA